MSDPAVANLQQQLQSLAKISGVADVTMSDTGERIRGAIAAIKSNDTAFSIQFSMAHRWVEGALRGEPVADPDQRRYAIHSSNITGIERNGNLIKICTSIMLGDSIQIEETN